MLRSVRPVGWRPAHPDADVEWADEEKRSARLRRAPGSGIFKKRLICPATIRSAGRVASEVNLTSILRKNRTRRPNLIEQPDGWSDAFSEGSAVLGRVG